MALPGFNKKEINIESLPKHIGIIMDGNGRWAKKHSLPRTAGHVKGAQNFRTITRYCSDIGIKYLTVYVFSTENWTRPGSEVDALMKLFNDYLDEIIVDFGKYNMKLNFIGDIESLSDTLKEKIYKTMDLTKDLSGITVNIALNYGGRQEIIHAVKMLLEKQKNGELNSDNINEDTFSEYLYTKGQPDPDLIIRPSGEQRLSNFMLWQSAYAEFWYSDVLWPDFKKTDLDKALADYAKRNRRFGGI